MASKRKFSVRIFLDERERRTAEARARTHGMRLPAFSRLRITGLIQSPDERVAVKRALRPLTEAEAEIIRLTTLLAYQLEAIARYMDEVRLAQAPANWWALEVAMRDIALQMEPLRKLCVRLRADEDRVGE